MTDAIDPWSVPVTVPQIPDTGLHRDLEADQTARIAMAEVAGLREILSASASLDVTPSSGGRFHVTGRVRARVGQTCVVTLDPIENDIDEADRSDVSRRPSKFRCWPIWSTKPPTSDSEIPDPPEPIENGVIDLGPPCDRRVVLGD